MEQRCFDNDVKEKLIFKVLQDTGMEQSKPAGSTIDVSKVVNSADPETLSKNQYPIYRSIVGRIMYKEKRTSPKFSVATRMMASYTSRPKMSHMPISKRVLRYLNVKKEYSCWNQEKRINLHRMSMRVVEISSKRADVAGRRWWWCIMMQY